MSGLSECPFAVPLVASSVVTSLSVMTLTCVTSLNCGEFNSSLGLSRNAALTRSGQWLEVEIQPELNLTHSDVAGGGGSSGVQVSYA